MPTAAPARRCFAFHPHLRTHTCETPSIRLLDVSPARCAIFFEQRHGGRSPARADPHSGSNGREALRLLDVPPHGSSNAAILFATSGATPARTPTASSKRRTLPIELVKQHIVFLFTPRFLVYSSCLLLVVVWHQDEARAGMGVSVNVYIR